MGKYSKLVHRKTATELMLQCGGDLSIARPEFKRRHPDFDYKKRRVGEFLKYWYKQWHERSSIQNAPKPGRTPKLSEQFAEELVPSTRTST
jgi:hypothetical protein